MGPVQPSLHLSIHPPISPPIHPPISPSCSLTAMQVDCRRGGGWGGRRVFSVTDGRRGGRICDLPVFLSLSLRVCRSLYLYNRDRVLFVYRLEKMTFGSVGHRCLTSTYCESEGFTQSKVCVDYEAQLNLYCMCTFLVCSLDHIAVVQGCPHVYCSSAENLL